MPSNVGNQTVNVKFFDGVVNSKVNSIGMSVRRTGIYTGGHLYKVSDTAVNVSALTCEIQDSGATAFEQVYIQTTSTVSVTVSGTSTMIILYWTYTGSAANDYMQFLAIAPANLSSYPNALVVGNTNAANGSGWQGFDYSLRSDPLVLDPFLKVIPSETLDSAPMSVRVKTGRVNYGTATYYVYDQLTSTLVAPGSGSQIVAVQVNTSGVVVLTYGAISGGSPTPPSYGGLVTLAEITLVSGQTSITAANIKDVRNFVSGSVPPNTYVDLTSNQSIAGTKTFTGGLVIPNVTVDPVSPASGQIWLNTSF